MGDWKIKVVDETMHSQKLEEIESEAIERPAVLYVDDEPHTLKYFTRAFERDFRVVTAASVDKAEELLESDWIGVVITDQRMPVQTGVELLDRVKTHYPDIVRLLTTAYADLNDAVAAVNRGEIYRYILKPWDIETLRRELRGALDLYLRQRYERDLLHARRQTIISLASHIAHELSTPLASIHTAISSIEDYLPKLVQSYRGEVESGCAEAIPEPILELMSTMPGMVLSLVDRTNMLIRLLLMNAAEEAEGQSDFRVFSVRQCVEYALRTYPFRKGEDDLFSVEGEGFEAFGSELLLTYVIYNLLKNALDAINEAKNGEIRIRLHPGITYNHLFFCDTGTGISPQVLPHIFDEFYSGKGAGRGTGMGLPFCRRVLRSFGGNIECRSRKGEYTELELTFPKFETDPSELQRAGGAPHEASR